MAMNLGAVLTLKDNFTATMKKAQEQQTKLRRDVQRMSRELDSATKTRDIIVRNSYAIQSVKKVATSIKNLKAEDIKLKVLNSSAVANVKKLHETVNNLPSVQYLKYTIDNSKAMQGIRTVRNEIGKVATTVRLNIENSRAVQKIRETQNRLNNFKRAVGLAVALRVNNSRTLQKIRETSNRVKEIGKTVALRVNNSRALAGIRQVINSSKHLRRDVALVIALKDRATAKIKGIMARRRELKDKNLNVTATDKTGGVFDSIKNRFTSLQTMLGGLVVGAGVGLGLSSALKGGAMLEQQQVAMEHFIGVNNEGMGQEQIKKVREQYIKDLRGLANATPFETADVVQAGARAVNIMGGDTSQAMDLTKIAGDMASLTPNKSISDAMEALADAKMGEFERLKEFGFKVSAEEFKGFVGKGKNDDLTDEETNKAYQMLMEQKLNPYFAGGSEKIAQTGAGMWSTVKGKLGTIKDDMGYAMLEKLKPVLEQVIGLIDRYTPKLNEMAGSFAEGFGTAIQWSIQFGKMISDNWGTVEGAFSTAWGVISPIFSTMKEIGMGVFETYKTAWGGMAETVQNNVGRMTPIISMVQSVITVLGSVVQAVIPIIANIFNTVFPIVAGLVGTVAGAIGRLVENVIAPLIPKIVPILESMWEKIKPILQALGDIITTVIEIVTPLAEAVFKPVFEGIVSAVQWAWDKISPLFDLINGAMQGISKGLDWVKDKFGIGDDDGGSSSSSNNNYRKYAVGIGRVPYDNFPALLHEGERVLTKKEVNQEKGNGSINIGKLADTVVVREEADIQKIAKAFVDELQKSKVNYGGAM